MSAGADQLKALRAAGYTDAQVASYQQDHTRALLDGGFSTQDVETYWGAPPFDSAPVQQYFAKNLASAQAPQEGQPAKSFGDYLDAGFQMSVTGLIKRQKMPDVLVPTDAPMWGRIASQVAQIAGDFPAMMAGAWAGGQGGAAVGAPTGAAIGSVIPGAGTAIGGGVGAAGGATLGAGYGSMALPAYLRRTLVDAYTKGSIKDAQDFWGRTAAAFLDAHHAGLVGAATLGAGSIVGQAAAPVMSPLLARTAQMASEVTTMVTMGKAVEGQLPNAQDFLDAAVLVGGLHLAGATLDTVKGQTARLAQKLGTTYAATGVRPDEVYQDAQARPTIRQDIASDNIDVPQAYQGQVDPQGLPPGAALERTPAPVSKAMTTETPATDPFKDGTPTQVAIKSPLEAVPGDIREPLQQHYEAAASAKPTFDAGVKAVADAVGGQAILPGLKAVPRAAEKAMVDYGGDATQLKDVVRGTVVVDSVEKAQAALEQAKAKFGEPVSVRNHLMADSEPASNDGYRDIKLNVNVDGHTSELQINAPEMLAAKEQAHPLYEQAQAIERTWKSESRDPTAQEYARYSALRDQQRQIYAAAWDRFLAKSRNASADSSVPLRSKDEMGNLRPAGTSQARQTPAAVNDTGTPSTSANVVPLGNETGNTSSTSGGIISGGGGGAKTPQDQVLERIAAPPERGNSLSIDKLYTALVDDLHPLKQLTRLLAGEKPLEVKDDPYQLARLTRGATGKADHFLEYGTLDFETLAKAGPGLSKVLAPVREDLDGFRAYALSRRVLELAARDIETGVPIEAAREVVGTGEAKFEQPFRALADYQSQSLAYLRDSGILSGAQYEAIKALNKDYVPMFRLMDEGQSSGTPNAGKGLSVRSPVKAIQGSSRLIIDPLESVIKNTYLYVQLAERNRALGALAELAEQAGPTGAEFMQRVERPGNAIAVDQATKSFAADNGLSDEDAKAMTVFRPGSGGLAKDEIALYREGVREVYKVGPDVASAVRALDKESIGIFVKMMAFPAKLMRAGTTLAPDFVGRNFLRDQMTAFILGDNGFLPVIDTLRGLGSLFTKDEDYQAWLKSGGANSAMVSLDRNYIEQNVFKLEGDTGLLSKTWNVIKSPIEMLRVTSEVIENATRLGLYKRETDGATDPNSIFEGGMGSREGTLDFQRIGAQTRALNMIVAFWNAHIQGLDKTARAFIDRPLDTAAKLAVSVTLPSVLLWFANKDDPRWAEIPRWQKDLFWIVFTHDHIYRVPKPMELGIIFGSLPERALEAYMGDNPKAFKDLANSLEQAFAPSYIPSFALPVLEQFANRSTFTGNPIVPSSLEKIMPEYQYSDYTSETGKLLGKFVAAIPGMRDSSLASPPVIENYVRAWSGQLGQYALQLADQALTKTGIVPDPVKPAATLSDIPAIKAFVVRYPAANAQSIQDFYEAFDKTQSRLATIKYLAKEGHIDAAMAVMRLSQAEGALVQLAGVKEALSTQSRFIRLVTQNPQMTPIEKRQIIDGVYYQMIQSTRLANQMLDAANRSMSAAGSPLPAPEPVGRPAAPALTQ